MTETWNVTASFDKVTYNQNDTMKITITGGSVLTQTTQVSVSGQVNVQSSDGATTTIPVGPAIVNVTTSTPESDKITSVTDGTGRVYTVSADGLSATAIA